MKLYLLNTSRKLRSFKNGDELRRKNIFLSRNTPRFILGKMLLKLPILIILILLLSILTVIPLFHSGFFEFHDNTQVVRVFEMGKSLSDGIFPVRWVEDLGYGYGYPIFNFYAPLSYYLGGFFVLFGTGALFATKAMFVVGILLSGISMFLLSKKFFGNFGGLVSAIVYEYFPYHAVNIYVRGAVDEFFAYAFLPLIFLGIFMLLEKKSEKHVIQKNLLAILSISFGVFLVSLSHNLSIYMTFLLFVPLIVASFFLVKSKKIFIFIFTISLVLGVLLSAFYVLPAFGEMKFTNVTSQIGGGADFRNNYVCPMQYWNSPWGYGGSEKGCIDGLSFRLGKTNIIFLIVAIILFVMSLYKKQFNIQEKTVLLSFILLIFSLFLTLQPSEFLWKTVPLMSFIQYPWRFMNFIGLFLSFIVGYIVFSCKKFFKIRLDIVVCIFIIGATIVTSYKLFVPQKFNSFSELHYHQRNYIEYTVSKISDEYLPKNFIKPKNPYDIPSSPAELINVSGNIGILSKKTGYLKAIFQTQNKGIVHINVAPFPAWSAYVDGKYAKITNTLSGMNVNVPQGSGILELKFIQTPIEMLGNILSIIAFLIILIMIVRNIKLRRIKIKNKI